MVVKVMIYLLLTLSVGVLGAYLIMGDDYIKERNKARASSILEVSGAINDAMDVYAHSYGEGQVDFGDPALGEEPFIYLKNKGLLRKNVGNDSALVINWQYNMIDKRLEKTVLDVNVCAQINNIVNQTPLSSAVPVCGTLQSSTVSCCFNP